MATLAQVRYDIREALKDFSDDSELDDRYIDYLLNIKRAKYLKQKIDRLGRGYNNRVLQTLCLETEEVSTNECGLDLSCDKIVRTKLPIPNLLQLSTKDALQRVSNSNKLSQKFNLINRERATLYLNSNFSKKIKAFLHDDNYIYLVSSEPIIIECLSITGIFEDPLSLENYKNCCNCDSTPSNKCFDPNNTEYPLQSELLDIVRTDIINELAKLYNIPEDKENNAEDDK